MAEALSPFSGAHSHPGSWPNIANPLSAPAFNVTRLAHRGRRKALIRGRPVELSGSHHFKSRSHRPLGQSAEDGTHPMEHTAPISDIIVTGPLSYPTQMVQVLSPPYRAHRLPVRHRLAAVLADKSVSSTHCHYWIRSSTQTQAFRPDWQNPRLSS